MAHAGTFDANPLCASAAIAASLLAGGFDRWLRNGVRPSFREVEC
jgi:hypothetical protein